VGFAQEPQSAPDGAHRESRVEKSEQRMENEETRLSGWKWANFLVLAGAIVYMVAKNGGPFFAARSVEIRKDMTEAAGVRKDADERAAAVDRKLANLGAEVALVKAESERDRQAEAERLRQHREAEREKIQANAQREIESAAKAARIELRRYAADLAVELAEKKIQARMTGEIQDQLVGGFMRDLEALSAPAGSRN
jgi:F-type H+-transporting ATPase subunit b